MDTNSFKDLFFTTSGKKFIFINYIYFISPDHLIEIYRLLDYFYINVRNINIVRVV